MPLCTVAPLALGLLTGKRAVTVVALAGPIAPGAAPTGPIVFRVLMVPGQ